MLAVKPPEPMAVYMRALGITFINLAAETGIARQRLSEIANGHRDADAHQRAAIATTLGIPESILFG